MYCANVLAVSEYGMVIVFWYLSVFVGCLLCCSSCCCEYCSARVICVVMMCSGYDCVSKALVMMSKCFCSSVSSSISLLSRSACEYMMLVLVWCGWLEW